MCILNTRSRCMGHEKKKNNTQEKLDAVDLLVKDDDATTIGHNTVGHNAAGHSITSHNAT